MAALFYTNRKMKDVGEMFGRWRDAVLGQEEDEGEEEDDSSMQEESMGDEALGEVDLQQYHQTSVPHDIGSKSADVIIEMMESERAKDLFQWEEEPQMDSDYDENYENYEEYGESGQKPDQRRGYENL